MPKNLIALAAGLTLSVATLGGCATTAGVHREYVTAAHTTTIAGSAVVKIDRSQSFTGSPHSLTGAALTLTEPVGEVMATTAEVVLGGGFSGGVTFGDAPKPEAYGIELKVLNFDYKYDQLSNLGFAVTPKVNITVQADVAAPGGKPALHKTYSRKDYSAGAYIISFEPPEKVNRALHLALAEICKELLVDIAALGGGSGPGPIATSKH